MKIIEFIKKHPNMLILILIIVLIWFFSPIRYCTFPRDGGPGSSKSLKESKYLKVFICEYIPDRRKIMIDNNVFYIEKIWLERLWLYSKDYRFPKIYEYDKGQYNLIIHTGNHSLANHGIDWKFEDFIQVYGDIEYGHVIRREMKWSDFKDTLQIKILKKNPKTVEFTDSVGVVRLLKVKE